ncbi:MAG: ribokinase [Acidimicrobiia bacterium]
MDTDVAVVGSLNRDLTVITDRHPRPGETVLGVRHYWDNGGKGANQAVAAARLGANVAMVGRVGSDDHGRVLRSSLADEGIDVSGVDVDPDSPTGVAVITIDSQAENTIVVSPGANSRLAPEHVHDHSGLVSSARVVLAQLEVPMDALVAAAGLASGTFCLNPAPASEIPAGMLDRLDILIPNRTELAVLAGTGLPDSHDEVARAVSRIETDAVVIVTLGSQGALIVEGDEWSHVAAPRVDAVDPTGAGDAFCGALAWSLSRGVALGHAVERAVVAGALAATKPGAQAAMPHRDDVERMFAS